MRKSQRPTSFPHFTTGLRSGVAAIARAASVAWLLASLLPLRSAETSSSLNAWLGAQARIETWSADFVQTRFLKTLTQPLSSTGHVWFAVPNRFRWEIGTPPSTIALREADEMVLVYPRLKRAERYSLAGAQAGRWKDMMALVETGFPRSRAEIESRFLILSESVSNGVAELRLQPKTATARRMMPEVRIGFGTNDLSLRSTEMQFADGSRMRNDFTHPAINPKIEPDLFTPKLSADYTVVEPLKGK